MKRLLSLILLASLCLSPAKLSHAQANEPSEPSDTAPRAYGLTLGGSYVFLNRLPLRESAGEVRPGGVQLAGRFGWQVRGLRSGAPATVGFETDFLFQPARRARDSYALIYGVFAKHSLSSHLRVRPFFSYGLGAAQVWVTGVGGRGIGHASRLGFGVDVRVRERWHVSIVLTYQGILMPRFTLDAGRARDTSFHGCVLSTGLWFGS